MRAVNLIPREQRSGGGSLLGSSGGAALIVLALIVGVAALTVVYGGARRQIAKESGEVAKIEAQASEVRARTGRLAPYSAFVSMAEQRTKTVAQLVQARFDWSHALHELGRVLPSGSKLLSLSGTVGAGTGSSSTSTSSSAAAAPASSTPPGSTPTLSLTGCSVSQSEVAQTLQRLKLMDGATGVHLQSAVKAVSSSKSSSGKSSSGGASSGGSGGGCQNNQVSFSITVTFAALPSTPIPDVASTTPASSTATKGAREAVSTQAKGAQR